MFVIIWNALSTAPSASIYFILLLLFFFLHLLWTPGKIILNVNKYECNFLQFCNYFDVYYVLQCCYGVVCTVTETQIKTVKIHWKYKSAKEQTWKYVIISVLKRHEIILHIFLNASVIYFINRLVYGSHTTLKHLKIPRKYDVNWKARRWRHVMTLFVAVTSSSVNEQTIVPNASFFKITLTNYFIIRGTL